MISTAHPQWDNIYTGCFFIFCIFKRMPFSHAWPNFLFLSGMCSLDLTILYPTSIWMKPIHNMPWSTYEKVCLFLDKNLGIWNMSWNIVSETDRTFYCWYTPKKPLLSWHLWSAWAILWIDGSVWVFWHCKTVKRHLFWEWSMICCGWVSINSTWSIKWSGLSYIYLKGK